MKHDDKDHDDKKHGDSKSSHGASSFSQGASSHGSKKNDKAGDFDSSKILDENGNFYGLPVSKELAGQLDTFAQVGIPYVRRWLEEHGTTMGRDFALNNLGYTNVAEAMKFGQKAGAIAGLGLIFSKQIFQIGDNIRDTANQLSELNKAAKPIMQAGGESGSFASDNEGIKHARAKINQLFFKRLANTVAGAASALPQLYIRHLDMKAKAEINNKKVEFEMMKDASPEEKAKWFREQMELKLPGGAMMDSKVKAAMMEQEYKEYMAGYESFKAANRSSIESELKKELMGFEKEADSYKLHNWERYGEKSIDHTLYDRETYMANKEADASKRGKVRVDGKEVDYWDAYKDKVADELESKLKAQKKRLDAKFKVIVEDEIKARYVRKNGAYDQNWSKYMYFGEDKASYGRNGVPKVETIKEQREAELKKLTEQLNGLTEGGKDEKHGKDDKKHDAAGTTLRDTGLGLLGGVVGNVIENMMGGKLEHYKKPQAMDRVLHLQRALDKSEGGNTPDKVPGLKFGKESEESCSYAQYVHKTFQAHQLDGVEYSKGFAEIGPRYYEKLEKVKWDDAAIQKLNDDDLNPYEYAVKHIAKRLRDGRLSGHAFGHLVFDAKDKIVHTSGHDFGPDNASGMNENAIKDSIHTVLDRVSQASAAAVVMDEKDVSEALGRFSFTMDEIKQALGPNGLQGEEKAMFFALVNAQMPDKKVLCRVTGLSNDECEKLRTDLGSRFDKYLDAAVLELADILKNDPQSLQGIELTEAEQKLLTTIAQKASKEGVDVSSAVADKKELQSVETVVANATLALDGAGKQGGFWQKLVGRSEMPKLPADPVKPAATHDAHHDDKKHGDTHAHDSHDEPRKTSFADKFKDRDNKPSREHDSHDDHEGDKHSKWADDRKKVTPSSHADRFRSDSDDHSMAGKLAATRKGGDKHDHDPWGLSA